MRQISAKELYDELKRDYIESATGDIRFFLGNVGVVINATDIVGKSIESWLGEWMTIHDVYHDSPENSQSFPDYYLSPDKKHNLLEIKAFIYDNIPAFDIANFESYCESITTDAYRLDADYLIFGYSMDDRGLISIKKVWLKKIWEIAGTSKKYPLKTQEKRNVIYNIRPNSQFKNNKYVPFRCKEDFLNAIYETLKIYRPKQADFWKRRVIENYQMYVGETLNF